MQKIILVGQAQGKRSKEPLDGVAGRRLAALAGLDLPAFYARFERVNLLDAHPSKGVPFDLRAARERASQLREGWHGRKAVLLGREVASAFHLFDQADDYEWFKPLEIPPSLEVAVMPLPEGRSSWWNDPSNVESARRFMQRCNVGFLAIHRNKEKLPTGRPEKFTPEQILTALVACDGLPLQAANMLHEETGISITREAVVEYCDRYPALKEVRARCKERMGDVAEMNVGGAVRDGDMETTRWLLRSNMFTDRGYGLSVQQRINGRMQHDVRAVHLHAKLNGVGLDLSRYSDEQLQAIEEFASVLGAEPDPDPQPE